MALQLRELIESGPESWLKSARRTLEIEIAGLSGLAAAFDGQLGIGFCEAIDLIRSTDGRVILTGLGKSGHIARKIASTLASTGTPSMYMHPVEASHGDLGMITAERRDHHDLQFGRDRRASLDARLCQALLCASSSP